MKFLEKNLNLMVIKILQKVFRRAFLIYFNNKIMILLSLLINQKTNKHIYIYNNNFQAGRTPSKINYIKIY